MFIILDFYDKLLFSNIISHGFLDFVHHDYDTKTFLSLYIILIIIFFALSIKFEYLFIFYFVTQSCHHFQQDYTFIFNNNYKYLAHSFFMSSIVLHFDYWKNILSYFLEDSFKLNILLFVIILYLGFYVRFIKGIKLYLLVYIQFITCYVLGTYKFILYYLSLIHVPIALYKSFKINGLSVLPVHFFFSILIYLIPFYVNVYLIKIIVSILNVHMITLDKWNKIHY